MLDLTNAARRKVRARRRAGPLRITGTLISRLRSRISKEAQAARAQAHQTVFMPAVHPETATPEPDRTIAQDTDLAASSAWAAENATAAAGAISMSSAYAEGLVFPGYAYLSQLAQRPEYRRMVEIIAQEMTRKWIRLTSNADGDENDERREERIRQLGEKMEELKVRDAFCAGNEYDSFFGRGHIYIDIKKLDSDSPEEMKSPIGDGLADLSRAKVNRQTPVVGIRAIEPVWVYPIDYNSTDPLSPDWYKPARWYVLGKEIHASRIPTLISRPVPDLLKPAYSFGGLALTQMAKPYVDNWLRTRQSVSDLLHSFSVQGVKTNLADLLAADGDLMVRRLELFNLCRDNRGAMLLDKETEEFFNVTTPISGLDHLQAQSQEHMAAVAGIPLVKLFGITPSGLNASSDGEIRTFYDTILAWQERVFSTPLRIIMNFIQLSLWDEVDPSITFTWVPLWSLDAAGEAGVRKTEADTDAVLIDAGVIRPEESRRRVAADPSTPYASLDVDDVPIDPNNVPDLEEIPPDLDAAEGAAGGGSGEKKSPAGKGAGGKPAGSPQSPVKHDEALPELGDDEEELDDLGDVVPMTPRELRAQRTSVQREDRAELRATRPRPPRDSRPGPRWRVRNAPLDADRRASGAMEVDAEDAKFEESKHPRGQPGNAGQFGSGGGGSKSAHGLSQSIVDKAKSASSSREFLNSLSREEMEEVADHPEFGLMSKRDTVYAKLRGESAPAVKQAPVTRTGKLSLQQMHAEGAHLKRMADDARKRGVTLNVVQHPDHLELMGIFAKNPGSGQGSAVLKQLTSFADQTDREIRLIAAYQGSETDRAALDPSPENEEAFQRQQERLVNFYKRNGFVPSDDNDPDDIEVQMVRKPRNKSADAAMDEAKFNEADHPRDADGKFTSGGGGGKSGIADPVEAAVGTLSKSIISKAKEAKGSNAFYDSLTDQELQQIADHPDLGSAESEKIFEHAKNQNVASISQSIVNKAKNAKSPYDFQEMLTSKEISELAEDPKYGGMDWEDVIADLSKPSGTDNPKPLSAGIIQKAKNNPNWKHFAAELSEQELDELDAAGYKDMKTSEIHELAKKMEAPADVAKPSKPSQGILEKVLDAKDWDEFEDSLTSTEMDELGKHSELFDLPLDQIKAQAQSMLDGKPGPLSDADVLELQKIKNKHGWSSLTNEEVEAVKKLESQQSAGSAKPKLSQSILDKADDKASAAAWYLSLSDTEINEVEKAYPGITGDPGIIKQAFQDAYEQAGGSEGEIVPWEKDQPEEPAQKYSFTFSSPEMYQPSTNKHEHLAKVDKVLSSAAKNDGKYRALLKKLIEDAGKLGNQDKIHALQGKMIESFMKLQQYYANKGDAKEAAKVENKVNQLTEAWVKATPSSSSQGHPTGPDFSDIKFGKSLVDKANKSAGFGEWINSLNKSENDEVADELDKHDWSAEAQKAIFQAAKAQGKPSGGLSGLQSFKNDVSTIDNSGGSPYYKAIAKVVAGAAHGVGVADVLDSLPSNQKNVLSDKWGSPETAFYNSIDNPLSMAQHVQEHAPKSSGATTGGSSKKPLSQGIVDTAKKANNANNWYQLLSPAQKNEVWALYTDESGDLTDKMKKTAFADAKLAAALLAEQAAAGQSAKGKTLEEWIASGEGKEEPKKAETKKLSGTEHPDVQKNVDYWKDNELKGGMWEKEQMNNLLKQIKDPANKEAIEAKLKASHELTAEKKKQKEAEIAEAQKKHAEQQKLAKAEQEKKNAEALAKYTSDPVIHRQLKAVSAIMGHEKITSYTIDEVNEIYEKAKKAGYENMSGPEAMAVKLYSETHYSDLNSQIRAGTLDEKNYEFRRALESALQKIPAYKGVSRRGAHLSKDQAAFYKPGAIIEERGFMSTTKNSDVSFGNGGYTFEVTGATGRHIRPLSSHYGENEVLFPAGTHFKVDKVEGKKIYMTEMT